eukprot:s1050_g11.t1
MRQDQTSRVPRKHCFGQSGVRTSQASSSPLFSEATTPPKKSSGSAGGSTILKQEPCPKRSYKSAQLASRSSQQVGWADLTPLARWTGMEKSHEVERTRAIMTMIMTMIIWKCM